MMMSEGISAKFLIYFSAVLIIALVSSSEASGNIALPGKCTVAPLQSWSPQEKWVWIKLCSGKIADFNNEEYGGQLNPEKMEGWPEGRIITFKFLEKILLDEPYRSAIPHQGVRIVGAWFKDKINLSNSLLAHQLKLDNSRFDADIDISSLKNPYSISFNGSKLEGMLEMSGLQIDQSLFIAEGGWFKNVNLVGAKVGGQVSMVGSTFEGMLNMDSLEVSGSLLMRGGARFKDVRLLGAKIGGQVSMAGSTFNGILDMDSLEVDGNLFMYHDAKFKDVNLRGTKVGGQVSMVGSTFDGTLIMDSLEVSSSLFMSESASFKDVNLVGAKVGGQVSMVGSTFKDVDLIGATVGGQVYMTGSTFNGKLDMDSFEVDGNLFMYHNAKFKDVNLRGAKVGGQVSMVGSTFDGTLIMDSLEVSSSLFMSEGASFKDVNLNGAKVGGQLATIGSTFEGSMNMKMLQVNEDLLMRECEFRKTVEMPFVNIGSNLDFSSSKFVSINLTGAIIEGELSFGSGEHPQTDWISGAKLILRNTRTGAIQDLENAWPDEIILDGFSYSYLGGYGAGSEHSMAYREVTWLKLWLARQKHFSPQPYEQMGRILKESGFHDKANDILFAGKQRERMKAEGLKWLCLFLQEKIVGYGYRNYYTLWWILGFTMLGFFVLQWTGQGGGNTLLQGRYDQFLYSFDILIPVVKLNEAHHEKVKLTGFSKYYFNYIQKIIGYILISFFIAGLSGITKY